MLSKIAISGLLAVFLTTPLKAQNDGLGVSIAGEPVSFGLKAGVNTHNFTDQQPHTGSKSGLSAGAFAAYPLSDVVSLQLGAAYFQQGGTYVQLIDDTRFGTPENYSTKYIRDASVTLHNLYVPLQAKLSVFDDEVYLPEFLIGPYMDINLAARESYERTGQFNNQFVTSSGNGIVTDRYERFQFGATGGLHFTIPTDESFSLLFEVFYKYGISPVRESYSYIDFYNVNGDINSHALSVSVGVEF
jgi:hypothetical protein